MASTYLTRTPSSNGNRQVFTFSFWLKRTKLGSTQYFISQGSDNDNNFAMYFDANDHMGMWDYGSGYNWRYTTNRKFKDINAWYHILLRASTTDGTAQDRMKLYINGVQETSFSTNTTASSSLNTHVNQSGNALKIGIYTSGSNYFDGLMSHFHLADGTAYEPSTFGETDSTTGEWKIKTSPSVSYGTNGFFILKDGNSVTDQSGQSNNLTVGGGTLTKSEDCPSNVFATFNPLDWENRNIALTNGNGTATNTDTANWQAKYAMSTLAMSAGKYYAEFKVGNIGTNQLYVAGVIAEPESQNINSSIGSFGLGLYSPGKIFNLGSEAQTSLGAIVADDIIGVAFDVTNGTLQFYKNGSTIGSQITSIATAGKLWRFGVNGYDGTWVMHSNFGNGYFGTTAVSSAGTNASGNGIFEYDVPTGYTALSTKGLNE